MVLCLEMGMSTQDYTEKVWSPWSHYKEVARMKGETQNVQRPEAGSRVLLQHSLCLCLGGEMSLSHNLELGWWYRLPFCIHPQQCWRDRHMCPFHHFMQVLNLKPDSHACKQRLLPVCHHIASKTLIFISSNYTSTFFNFYSYHIIFCSSKKC